MNSLSERARRSVALAALTVAYVVGGPNPQVRGAIERIYAVAVVGDEQESRRQRDVGDSRAPLSGPPHTRPGSQRPDARPASGRP